MHLVKYGEGWTRRHFLDQLGKGIFAAGVLSPLLDVIGRDGNCDAAYPPDLLSIDAYTKGKLKAGDVLHAENVDVVKDVLDPAAYWQIKHDGRLVDPAPTETNMTRMMPMPYLQATLSNKSKHKIFPDGNVYTLEVNRGLVVIRSHNLRVLRKFCGQHPKLGEARTQAHPVLEFDTDADGNVLYEYASYGVEWQTVGRLTLDPHPYMSGRKSQLRIGASTMVAPGDVNGTGFLQVWAYDQHKLPGFYAFLPDTKRVRTYPVDQASNPYSRAIRPSLQRSTWRAIHCLPGVTSSSSAKALCSPVRLTTLTLTSLTGYTRHAVARAGSSTGGRGWN